MVSIGICGLKGSGKTAFATMLGYTAYKKGQKVLSNYRTSYSELINPVDYASFNNDLNNVCIILDFQFPLYGIFL